MKDSKKKYVFEKTKVTEDEYEALYRAYQIAVKDKDHLGILKTVHALNNYNSSRYNRKTTRK